MPQSAIAQQLGTNTLPQVIEETIVKTDDRRYLKVKAKTLAAEARIIRKEEGKVSGMEKWHLQHHRKTVVRDAARTTYLAYGLIRDRTLEQTAAGYKQRPGDYEAVLQMVKKYGSAEHRKNLANVVMGWFNASTEQVITA